MSKQLSQRMANAAGRFAAAAMFTVAAFATTASASAGVLKWTMTGPGETEVRGESYSLGLNYDALSPSPNQVLEWTATATADEAGDYHFFWDYWGAHGSLGSTHFLYADSASGSKSLLEGAAIGCCGTPFETTFMYYATYTFKDVAAGDVLQFRFGGSNAVADGRLRGSLGLTQWRVWDGGPSHDVPEPASLALLGLGLASVAAARRRAKR